MPIGKTLCGAGRKPRGKIKWCTGMPDRSGMAVYTHLIRALNDPERTKARGKENHDKSPHLTLKKTTTAQWVEKIRKHLADGEPRTFNRICVELSGYNADVMFDSPADSALWKLVSDGELEWCDRSPVMFRLKK